MEEDRSMKCGVGSWRPSWLQRFANLRSFTATLSLLSILGNMNYSYYTAVITQIELQFGLSSSWTGLIKNIDNIGYMSCSLLVAHFCRYSNKPRLFAASTVLASAAIFIFAIPHFLYGTSGSSPINQTANATKQKYELCTGEETPDKCSAEGGGSVIHAVNTGAIALFIVSELIQGIAQSPKFTLSVTYMDDNSKKNSAKHMGVMFGMRAFSPVLGFLMGAWATSIYVDLSDPGLDQQDPRWIGAWWLGFVICSACSFIPALPLALFPKNVSKQTPQQIEEEKKAMDVKNNIKDLPAAIGRLVRNPLIVSVLCGAIFNVYLMGYSTFIPKYLAMQFQVTASMASILTGCISIVSWSMGPIVSGCLVSKMKMTPATAVKFVVFANVVSLTGFTIKMFLGCPDPEWATEMTFDRQETDPQCSLSCGCDPNEYVPICGSDGLNYYSPCLAGCQKWDYMEGSKQKIFSDCSCIANGTGTAIAGQCPVACNMVIPFIIIHAVAAFCASMTSIPMLASVMRTSSEKDKALALAVFGFVINLASFPAPMVFGLVIDSSCLVRQQLCGNEGACLLYDRTDFRYKFHGFAIIAKICAMVCYIIAWYKTRHMTEPINGSDDREAEVDKDEKEREANEPMMEKESNV